MTTLDNYEAADQAFRSGKILSDSNQELLRYLHGLSNLNNVNSGTQHRDIIRGFTINQIMLQRHIDKLQAHISDLDAKNARTQCLVMWLTIAALFAGIAQATTAILPYVGINPPSPIAASLPRQATESLSPTPVKPPVSDPKANSKN